jgi:hypothetical protein
MRFVYLGPPDEPEVMGTTHGASGDWVKGEPRDIADPAVCARLARHPHWAAMDGEAFIDPPEVFDAPLAAPRRGRPPKVRHDG